MEQTTPNPVKFNRSEWLLLSALAFLQFTHIVDFVIMMPLGPTLVDSFGIDTHQFSFLVSGYTFAAAFSALFASLYIDRFERKKTLLVIFFGFMLGTLLCGFSQGYYMLLGSRILTGLFGGLINAMIYTIIGDRFPYTKRGSAMGVLVGAFSVASIAGVPLGLKIAQMGNWNLPFFVLGFLGVPFMVYAWFILPEMKPAGRSHNYIDLLKEKNHYIAFAFVMTMMLTGFSIIPFISNYLVFNTGFSRESLPTIYLFGGIASFFSSRLFGYFADRFGKKRTYFVAALFSVIPVYWISHLEGAGYIATLGVTTLMFIFFTGRMVPAMALITASVVPGMRGSFMSMNSAIQQLGSAVATLTAGYLIKEMPDNHIVGYDHVSYFSIACIFISFLFLVRIKVFNDNE